MTSILPSMSETEELHYQACPVCGSSISNWRDKQKAGKLYHIDICNSCDYAFVNPRPSLQFLMEYYESSGLEPGVGEITDNHINLEAVLAAERDDPNPTLDAKRIVSTLKSLMRNVVRKSFLDVGSGYGFFSREAIENGFKVSALELGSIDRLISKQIAGVDAVESSFEDYEAPNGSYSVVLMSQILEHARDVNGWMEKTRKLLTDQGIVVIALPNFGSIFRKVLQEKEPFITPPTHLNFFTVKSLTALLKSHGFEVLKVQCVSRIAKRAISKRLPSPLKLGAPILKTGTQAIFSLIDAFNLGMIINVYGRKIPQGSHEL